jgi:elongation factor 3
VKLTLFLRYYLNLQTDVKAAADRLAREVSKTGFESLKSVNFWVNFSWTIDHISLFSDHGVLSSLHTYSTNKKSGYERESAAIALQSLASTLGEPSAPLLLPSLPILFDLYADKGDVVRSAAAAAAKAILKLCPPESTRIIFRSLEGILEGGKWQTKVGVLDALKSFVGNAPDAVAAELGIVLPKVEAAMHDTKKEVSGTNLPKSCQYNISKYPSGLFCGYQMCYISLYNTR